MNQSLDNFAVKSGTSIVGLVCAGGVVVAADKRSTIGGQIVHNKNVLKAQKVNDYIVVAGTGNAVDIELNRKVLAAELRLLELRNKSRPTIEAAANLAGMMAYRNIRTPSVIPSIAGFIFAGVNEDGTAELYSIEPAGGVSKIEDYDANFSSGMPYILGLLERNYKPNMPLKDAVELAKDCIKAAIERDTASGNGIDVFTLTKEGIKQVIAEVSTPQYK